MRSPLRSLYGRISALYLILALALCLLCAGIILRYFTLFADELDQKLNRDLAPNLAAELAPALGDTLDAPALRLTLAQIITHNPALELYVLDAEGRVLAASIDPEKVMQEQVALAPIRRLLDAGTPLPVHGDDPGSISAKKTFSAAPVTLAGGAPGYLYVILRGMPFESAAAMIRDSYILRGMVASLLMTLGFTALVGLVLFALLTRRFRRLTETVQRFKAGRFDQRARDTAPDEIGELGRVFNEMAATIEAQVEALRRTDEARRTLVANISHDLRTPLTSTRGYVERMLIKQGLLEQEEQRAYLRAILKNTRKLSRLVEQLAELSRLDARQVPPSFERFSLAELVQDVCVHFRPEAEHLKVRLEAAYDAALPPVYADIGLTERVLANLLDNALHNTPPGGTVRIALAEVAGAVRVLVEDTGCGIPADELPLVTQRFYRTARSRAHTGNGNGNGSGLGLAISQEIAALHGGTLHLASTPGKGTTASFCLPIKEVVG